MGFGSNGASVLGKTDGGGAAIAETESSRCSLGKIDDALAMEWTAVVDDDFDRLTTVLIGDLHFRAEGKGTMCRRHGVLVKYISRCCPLAVEAGAVPGSATTLCVSCRS